jgi:hypothetical protein
MRTMELKLTDLDYEVIAEEATKRGSSVNEVINDLLHEGLFSVPICSPDGPPKPASSPEEEDALFAKEEHDMAECRALRKWHESLRKAS